MTHFGILERRPIPPGNRNVPLCKIEEEDEPVMTTDWKKVTCQECLKKRPMFDPEYTGDS